MAPSPAIHLVASLTTRAFPKPNYVNPVTRDWTVAGCLLSLYVVTVAVFVGRIWARFRVTKSAGLDDWVLIASMPLLIGHNISTILGLRVYGFQLHIYDLRPNKMKALREAILAIETLYLASVSLTKISILLFFRRLSSSLLSRPFKIAVWASLVFVAAYGIASPLVVVFTCWPVEAFWSRFSASWRANHDFKCGNELDILIALISISAVQDVIACLMPMFVVNKLRLPLRQKIGLVFVFSVGLVTCGTGFFRVYLAVRANRRTHALDYDPTWESLPSWVATTVEANLAVVSASMPALKVYMRCFQENRPIIRGLGWYHQDLTSQGTTTVKYTNSVPSSYRREAAATISYETTSHD